MLIATAKVAEGVSKRLRLNALVAYTATGVLLGPVTGLVELTAELEVLLGIGVFLLFFLVGLDEIDGSAVFASLHGKLVVIALLAFLTPMFFAYCVTSQWIVDFGFGLSDRQALAVATILSLSSLGIVAKVLAEEGRLRDPLGIQIFTTILIIKLMGLPLMGFLLNEDGAELHFLTVLTLVAETGCFGVLAYLFSRRVLPPLFVKLKRGLRVPQLSFGLVLGGLFLMVAGAGAVRLHGSLGALLFGAALSGLPYQLRREVVPGMRSIADGVFVPLFFASGGLQLSLALAKFPLVAMAALLVVPVLAKFAGVFFGAVVLRIQNPAAFSTGFLAKGITEIALLLVLLESNMIGEELFSLLMMVLFVYLLALPPLVGVVARRSKPSGADGLEAAGSSGPLPPSLTRFALADVKLDDILDRSCAFPGPDLTVREFAEQWVGPHQHEYVVAEKGQLAGLVSVSMLRYLPKSEWSKVPLGDVIRRISVNAWQDEYAEEVLEKMQEHSLTALPVVDRKSGRLIGAVTSEEIHELITMDTGSGH